jgi:hypothetical protein
MSEIGAAQEELSTAYQEAGRSFYAQNQSAPQDPGAPADSAPQATDAGAKGDEVAEADYEIVDDSKTKP